MTTTTTTNFGLPIPPLGSVGAADGYGTLMQAADTAIYAATGSGALATAWVNYSATSTIVGWGSFITKVIKYKKIGTIMLVSFELIGTSNSTSVTFTLPNVAVGNCRSTLWSFDNGSTYGIGTAYITSGAAIVTCVPTADTATGWTAGNLKEAVGQFFYEVA